MPTFKKEERAQILRWIAEGVKIDSIARRLGRNPSTLRKWMAQHGITTGRQRKRGVLNQKISYMNRKGRTDAEMAEILGVHISLVNRRRRAMGLPRNITTTAALVQARTALAAIRASRLETFPAATEGDYEQP